jgi:hypothetical protein
VAGSNKYNFAHIKKMNTRETRPTFIKDHLSSIISIMRVLVLMTTVLEKLMRYIEMTSRESKRKDVILMCVRIYFHIYVNVTSVIYQRNNA